MVISVVFLVVAMLALVLALALREDRGVLLVLALAVLLRTVWVGVDGYTVFQQERAILHPSNYSEHQIIQEFLLLYSLLLFVACTFECLQIMKEVELSGTITSSVHTPVREIRRT